MVTAEGAQVGRGASGLRRENVRKMIQGMNSWKPYDEGANDV